MSSIVVVTVEERFWNGTNVKTQYPTYDFTFRNMTIEELYEILHKAQKETNTVITV